jgi:deazaflavin-dependent oxidoreductase (nitroreductase family)
MTDLTRYAKKSTVQLTTIGRKSGQPRTVTIWFVVVDAKRIHVQHARGSTAQWYRNLLRTPEVQLDFGDGLVAARATPIEDKGEIQRVLALVRRKYLFAWVFQLLGINRNAVAATIELDDDRRG